MKQQKGFTLIELIVVIVILGILAATALPRFVDFQADARLAAVQGVAGAMSSAGAINYANRSINAARGVAVDATICSEANASWNTLMQGGVPAGYTIAAGNPAACNNGVVGCLLTGTFNGNTSSQNFTMACIN